MAGKRKSPMAPKDVALMVSRAERLSSRLERGVHFQGGKVPGSTNIVYPPLANRTIGDDGWVMFGQFCEAHIAWFPAERGWEPGINVRCSANNVDDVAQFSIPMARAFARALLKCARLAEKNTLHEPAEEIA